MSNHTPLDSLQYLASTSSLLDWCDEELDGINGPIPDIDAVRSALNAFSERVRHELNAHGGRQVHYSTGHPVEVHEKRPGLEPDPDGGPDRVVIQRFFRTGYPDGGLDHPTDRKDSRV